MELKICIIRTNYLTLCTKRKRVALFINYFMDTVPINNSTPISRLWDFGRILIFFRYFIDMRTDN